MTLDLILGIIDSLLKLAVISADKMTPEQFQRFIDRHEDRMAFFVGLAKKLSPGA